MSFNKIAFLEDVEKVHLKVGDTLSNTNIRKRLDEFIDYDKSLFSKALDEVCSNMVGNTMFTLLMTKLPPGMRLRISMDIDPEEVGKLLVDQTGSSYAHKLYAVKINLNVYGRDGMGIPERQYYCINESCGVTLKRKSLSASIFHEFTHCLHHVEDRGRYSEYKSKDSLPNGDPWDTKEERRTMSGYIEADAYEPRNTYDPICDNCFHLYNSIAHGKPYIPRIEHCGYRSNTPSKAEQDRRDKLLQYYKTPDFRLAWPEQYVISRSYKQSLGRMIQ